MSPRASNGMSPKGSGSPASGGDGRQARPAHYGSPRDSLPGSPSTSGPLSHKSGTGRRSNSRHQASGSLPAVIGRDHVRQARHRTATVDHRDVDQGHGLTLNLSGKHEFRRPIHSQNKHPSGVSTDDPVRLPISGPDSVLQDPGYVHTARDHFASCAIPAPAISLPTAAAVAEEASVACLVRPRMATGPHRVHPHKSPTGKAIRCPQRAGAPEAPSAVRQCGGRYPEGDRCGFLATRLCQAMCLTVPATQMARSRPTADCEWTVPVAMVCRRKDRFPSVRKFCICRIVSDGDSPIARDSPGFPNDWGKGSVKAIWPGINIWICLDHGPQPQPCTREKAPHGTAPFRLSQT